MAFKNISLAGTGSDSTAITVSSNEEIVITSFSIFNSDTAENNVKIKINGTIVYNKNIPAGSGVQETVKLAGNANDVIDILCPSTTVVTISYMSQPADIQIAIGIVQSIVDDIDNIDSVAQNVVPNMAEILQSSANASIATTKAAEAADSAQIAQSTAKYKGDWISNYNSGAGYSIGDSVTYNSRKYMSKADSNLDTPNVGSNWMLVVFGELNYINVSSDYTAVAYDGLDVDTSASTISVTLPATPLENDVIAFLDLKGTFDTNPLSIARNGNTLMGLAEDMVVDTKNTSFKLRFKNNDWRLV